ncbi:MAG TPA: diacylglycerol kinase [Nocardioidaceae bacterium]|nr:diacylglycerol kinase [Nocardioidaceae bacterium]
MTSEIALLINPAAGRGRGARAGRVAAAALRERGHRVRELAGHDGEEAADLAAAALEQEPDGLVVVGGDGMVHLAIQQMAGTTVPLGVVPAGTGNDVARYLGVPRRDPAAAAAVVSDGHIRKMDLARAGSTYYATVLASGFDGQVNERANAMSWPRGQMRYNVAVAAEMRTFEPVRFSLELDGARRDLEAMLVAVGNGPSYGGGLRMCEGAELDDGYLDVVVIKPVSKVELVKVFPRLFKGTHVTHPQYEHHRVTRVSLAAPGISAYADGERLGLLPMTVEVAPRALTVFAAEPAPRSLEA